MSDNMSTFTVAALITSPETNISNCNRDLKALQSFLNEFVLERLPKVDQVRAVPKTSTIKKTELLAKAKAGEPKPKEGERLYAAYYSYVSKASSAFDQKFTNEIKIFWPRVRNGGAK